MLKKSVREHVSTNSTLSKHMSTINLGNAEGKQFGKVLGTRDSMASYTSSTRKVGQSSV